MTYGGAVSRCSRLTQNLSSKYTSVVATYKTCSLGDKNVHKKPSVMPIIGAHEYMDGLVRLAVTRAKRFTEHRFDDMANGMCCSNLLRCQALPKFGKGQFKAILAPTAVGHF